MRISLIIHLIGVNSNITNPKIKILGHLGDGFPYYSLQWDITVIRDAMIPSTQILLSLQMRQENPNVLNQVSPSDTFKNRNIHHQNIRNHTPSHILDSPKTSTWIKKHEEIQSHRELCKISLASFFQLFASLLRRVFFLGGDRLHKGRGWKFGNSMFL